MVRGNEVTVLGKDAFSKALENELKIEGRGGINEAVKMVCNDANLGPLFMNKIGPEHDI